MPSSADDIVFLIPGTKQPLARGVAGATQDSATQATRGTVKASVRVSTRRGDSAAQRVVARPGEDVVVLTIANGPTLVLHPEAARDLMRAQGAAATRGASVGSASVGSDVAVPVELGWPLPQAAATRGIVGRVLLDTFEVLTGLAADPAARLATAALTKKVDNAGTAGVYELLPGALTPLSKAPDRKRPSVAAAADGGPLLVLLHGTFVDTASTFGTLWTSRPETVKALFARYAQRVYALDHPTVGQSPITNALMLVRALPAGARLHLLTHSRGGLVAEVLARVCGGAAVSDDDLALFKDPRYAQHRSDLAALSKEARAKALTVDRVVRVACPARGTLLASKRLDAYLSVLSWGLKLAGVPVAPELVDFLHEVARRRADPTELPGLEAMMPESPVVAWLNRHDEPIAGELCVVAGDMQGDSIASWAKTLLSDAFYWTDNDLVVQTRSMYGGAPRASIGNAPGASFVLDRGGSVSHFNYFSNERTVQAIARALLRLPGESQAAGLSTEFSPIGPLSWAGQNASGTRAARSAASAPADAAQRPAVFVLPGILGSNLALDGQRIWLGTGFVNALKSLAWDPATAGRVTPDGPVGSSYDALLARLADTHEVIAFAFDWRRPIEDEARRLADAVDAALSARDTSGQPVRLLAHSMGGLVARTMQIEAPAVWMRLMAREGARFLMLGTPNGGSWAPMQVLSGDDTFGNALVAFGALFDNLGARKMMAAMPGFIQMQAALLDPALGLGQASAWQKLADDDVARQQAQHPWHDQGPQRTVYQWGAPPQSVLDQAVALRRRLDAQAAGFAGDDAADAAKMLLVVGHARFTPAGITIDNDGLEYLNAPDGGDGRVTLVSALLPNVRTWTLDAAHGDLPSVASAFDAYVELLCTGTTLKLPALAAPATVASRGAQAPADAAALVRSRPSRGLGDMPAWSTVGDLFGQPVAEVAASDDLAHAAPTPLSVAVMNGDLKFVSLPLLVGHYRALTLTGTEDVVDRLIGGGMRQAMAAGLYPDAAGSQQIFVNGRRSPDNPLAMPRPQAVVVAGLGEEGKLVSADLVRTVRQAVLAYAQHLAQRPTQDAAADPGSSTSSFELAATLLGSGGTGITAGNAAQLIVQGACEAMQRLQGSAWPRLGRLVLIECYLDRASEAWRALQAQAEASPGRLELDGPVQFGTGGLRRPLDAGYRGTRYDFISALTVIDKDQQPTISYTLDTRRARAEVRAQRAQGPLLKGLVRDASDDGNRDPLIGRTLFKLLVPVEMEPFLGGTSEMLIELDAGTAVIPWELLDNADDAGGGNDQAGDPRPWAIRSKLLRKLRTERFRDQVADANAADHVLVIGEPLIDDPRYPALPAARGEAQAVFDRLTGADGIDAKRVRALLSGGDSARNVINALYEFHYRIVHIAGHGAPGALGGVVLSGGAFLGANEVQAMRSVPELVFLNCCHLAGRDANSTLERYDRAEFAANIAEALIEVGVRCVVAAGWAVEDTPAATFATTFYAELLRGARFIDAVAVAREAAWRANPQGNTWAAYQCYGDPGWIWRRDGGDAQRPAAPPGDEYAGIASPPALTLALEKLSTESRFGDASAATQLGKLTVLEKNFAARWGGMGAVAEAFGLAHADAQNLDAAIAWYDRALAAADASASFRAAEQLGNLMARRGEQRSSPATARREIRAAIARLQSLRQVQATAEREALLASAWKRLAMVEARAAVTGVSSKAEQAALRQAIVHYAAAAKAEQAAGSDRLFYPALNGIAAELRLAFLLRRPTSLSDERLAPVRASLRAAAASQPDFWNVVGQTELVLLQALGDGSLARVTAGVMKDLQDLKARVAAPAMWDSVWAQARFTLEPYRRLAEDDKQVAERRATDTLLKLFEALAATT